MSRTPVLLLAGRAAAHGMLAAGARLERGPIVDTVVASWTKALRSRCRDALAAGKRIQELKLFALRLVFFTMQLQQFREQYYIIPHVSQSRDDAPVVSA